MERLYEYITLRRKRFCVHAMCRVVQVSESGYYRSLCSRPANQNRGSCGEIVGLAMDDNMKKELCIRAFRSACQAQGAYGMILHSDRGSQFTSSSFRKVLAQCGAVQSMSGTGRCYDNARMESFFATLKKEKLYRIRTEQMPMAQVKSIVFRYIMTYYNRQRIYTANPGGLPPAMYRQAARGLAA